MPAEVVVEDRGGECRVAQGRAPQADRLVLPRRAVAMVVLQPAAVKGRREDDICLEGLAGCKGAGAGPRASESQRPRTQAVWAGSGGGLSRKWLGEGAENGEADE